MGELRVHAPGRVNLIGDHTDYVGGLALPMAIDLGLTLVGRTSPDRVVLRSDGFEGSVDLSRHPDGAWRSAPGHHQPGWGRYVEEVATELRAPTGLEGLVSTTLPAGAGLSSSAALEVAVALALGADRPPSALSGVELAQACQRAEHRASGVPCGLMDQLTSVCGVAGHALLVDFRSLSVEPVAIPSSVAVVVIHSGQTRRLADSAYADRRAQVEAAEREIGSLRDATTADLAGVADATARARARHVITENARVRAFAAALGAGDLVSAGAIMAESHASNRDDFEASTPVVDALVARLSTQPGVFGARLVGGGFGGCVVALADPGVLHDGWTVTASAGASVTRS